MAKIQNVADDASGARLRGLDEYDEAEELAELRALHRDLCESIERIDVGDIRAAVVPLGRAVRRVQIRAGVLQSRAAHMAAA